MNREKKNRAGLEKRNLADWDPLGSLEKFGAGGKLRTTEIDIPRHVRRITDQHRVIVMIDRRLLILLRIGINMDVGYRITNHFLKKKHTSHKPNYTQKYHPSVKKTQTQKNKKNKT